MLSFELGKEIEKRWNLVFSTAQNKEKILSPHEELNPRPSVLRQMNIKARWSAKKIATGENANQTSGYVTETQL